MKPKVALIYLSYFSEPYLDEVILSLSKLNYPKDQLMLIIVENASTDRSDAIIREQVLPKSGKELPEIIYLPQEKNTGFASGNNLGIQRALLEGAEYVYFLNNDAKLQSDALRHAIALAESDVKIGSVQSLMLLWQNPQKVNSTGGMVHFLGFGFVRDNGEFVKNITAKEGEEIAYASGAAVLYRARTLQEVGLLDPYLFLYHEDLELGWRIRLAGYRNVLSVKSIAYHHYEFSRSIQKYYWMERNRLFVHFSHLKLSTLVLLSPWLFGLEIALLFFAIKGGWISEKLLVYREWLRSKTWSYLKQKRKESAILRKTTDQDIVKLFTGRIEHQDVASPFLNQYVNPVLALIWGMMKFLIRW